MTERLADVSARIEGIRQLGAVVNAMKGIAAARAHTATAQIDAVDRYAATIRGAMRQSLGPETDPQAPPKDVGKPAHLVFLAEQGFAGAFSERVLDSIGQNTGPLFVIGTRGLSIATMRELHPIWSAPMPSHSQGIPKLADAITRAFFGALAAGDVDRLDVISTGWASGRPEITQAGLFPITLALAETQANTTDQTQGGTPLLAPLLTQSPLIQLPRAALLARFGADYLHAQICKVALHAFAAENQARMEAMTSAGNQIGRELETYEARLRQVRQEAITAEIIELSTGAQAAQKSPR